jgi:hypothetical protein
LTKASTEAFGRPEDSAASAILGVRVFESSLLKIELSVCLVLIEEEKGIRIELTYG